MTYITIPENKTGIKTVAVMLGIPAVLGLVAHLSIITKWLFAFVSIFATVLIAVLAIMAYADYKDGVVRKKPTTWGTFNSYIYIYYIDMIAMCLYFKYTYLATTWALTLVFTELLKRFIQATLENEE